MESLGDVNKRPQFLARYDYNNTISAHSKRIGEEVNKIVGKDGYSTIETKGIQEEMLQKTVKGALFGSDGKPTGLMKSFIKENDFDINNQDHLNEITDKYETDLRLAMGGGSKVDPNNADKIAASRLALSLREEKRAITKDNAETSTSTIKLSTNEKEQPVKVTKENGSIKKGAFEFSVNTTNEKNKIIGKDWTKITNWYLNPDNSVGYTYVVSKYNKKDDEWQDTKQQSSTGKLTDASLAAVNSGFEDVAQLSQYLQDLKASKIPNQEEAQTNLRTKYNY